MAEIKVRGLRELGQKLQRLKKSVQGQALREAGEAAAEPLEEGMKKRVRVRSGELQKDIGIIEELSTKRATTSVRIAVGPGEEQGWRAHFLEFGTAHHPAFPFIRPTFDQDKDEAVRIFKERLAAAIKRRS